MTDPALWGRALQVVDAVLDLEGPGRDDEVARLCDGDTELRSIVDEMLAADARSAATIDPATHLRVVEAVARDVWADLGADAADPERIGPYRVLGRLGTGGMGVVYDAEQAHPRRRVAVKVLHGWLASQAVRDAFAFEAQALADLRYPGIPEVYGAGVDGDLHWVAMERVAGTPLTVWAEERALARRDRLELFLRVCDIVHHAHEAGVVHRDLKPTNILVTGSGDVRVLDFGIAMPMGEQTVTGGTPGYMAPEQADPAAPVDARSDVYALGVVLHVLVTGRPALTARSPEARDPDVAAIVARATAEAPDARYPDVEALARDLRAVVAAPGDTVTGVDRVAWIAAGVAAIAIAGLALARPSAFGTLEAVIGIGGWIALPRVAAAARRWRSEATSERARANRAEAGVQFLGHVLDASVEGGTTEEARRVVDAATARLADGALASAPAIELSARASIARTLYNVGRAEAAVRQCHKILDAWRAGAPVAHDDLLDAAGIVASMAVDSWDADAAQRIAELEAILTESGDPTFAASMLRARLARNDPEKSVEIGLQACRESEEWLASQTDAREIVQTRRNLGIAWRFVGNGLGRLQRWDEGREALGKALRYEQLRGPQGQARVALVLDAFSVLERRAGDLEAAHAHALEALRIATEHLGAEHQTTGFIQETLARLELAKGRHAEAGRLAEDAIHTLTTALGPLYGQVDVVLAVAIDGYLGAKEPDEAVRCAEAFLAARTTAGADDAMLAAPRMLLAGALLGAGRLDAARATAALVRPQEDFARSGAARTCLDFRERIAAAG